MDKERIYFGSGLVALALVLAISAFAFVNGSSVTLNYSSPGGEEICYLAAFNGEPVIDQNAGLVFAVDDGRRLPVLWSKGMTARHSGSEIEVLWPNGKVFMRTDTRAFARTVAKTQPATGKCAGWSR